MGFLVMFLLGFSLAEGIIVNKCDLRRKVLNAIGPLMGERGTQGNLTVEDTVAKLVCHVELASGFNTAAVNQLTPWSRNPHSKKVWTLYGLFQLSNHLICRDHDNTDLSETICRIDCSNLIDDNIDDDIKCLQMTLAKLLKEGWNNRELINQIKLIFVERCAGKKAKEYFHDCIRRP